MSAFAIDHDRIQRARSRLPRGGSTDLAAPSSQHQVCCRLIASGKTRYRDHEPGPVGQAQWTRSVRVSEGRARTVCPRIPPLTSISCCHIGGNARRIDRHSRRQDGFAMRLPSCSSKFHTFAQDSQIACASRKLLQPQFRVYTLCLCIQMEVTEAFQSYAQSLRIFELERGPQLLAEIRTIRTFFRIAN